MALDGHVIYGLWEEDGKKAESLLDACNGHIGPVPENTEYGIMASTTSGVNVYHYHTTSNAPYTVGCYGPVVGMRECLQLYPSCSDEAYKETLFQADGKAFTFKKWCPCYQHQGNPTGGNCRDASQAGCAAQASNDQPEGGGKDEGLFGNRDAGFKLPELGGGGFKLPDFGGSGFGGVGLPGDLAGDLADLAGALVGGGFDAGGIFGDRFVPPSVSIPGGEAWGGEGRRPKGECKCKSSPQGDCSGHGRCDRRLCNVTGIAVCACAEGFFMDDCSFDRNKAQEMAQGFVEEMKDKIEKWRNASQLERQCGGSKIFCAAGSPEKKGTCVEALRECFSVQGELDDYRKQYSG